MARSKARIRKQSPYRCEECGKEVAGHESVSLSSSGGEARLLCWRCFNTETAEAMGLVGFRHVDFEPVRLTGSRGRQHEFHIRTRLMGPGVALDAYEVRSGAPAGYEFHMMGEAEEDLFTMLGRLVEKIKRALAVKHVKRGRMGLEVVGQVVRGRIEWDDAEEGRVPMMVVDGKGVSWEEFGRMLMVFEGWQFRLEVLDLSEEA